MFITDALVDADKVLKQFISNKENIQNIESAINLMVDSFNQKGRIFSCGNGGSMCDAMHFAEELTGRFRKERPALAAMAISDPSHISCVANDYGYEFIFSKYLEAWAQPNDVLLAISTSGQSKNVLEAVKVAKKKGMKVVGLSGKGGGELKSMVDVSLVVDSTVSDRIQEIHIKCIHIFIEGIERKLFPENYLT
jgi:D-sedoheptulose 7-phosphate isomerase